LAGAGQNMQAWWRAASGAQEAPTTDTSFITVWDLGVSGSGATQLTFGVATSGTVGYQWEEVSPGSATGSGTFSGSTLTITGLPSGATIRLKINPTNFNTIIINSGTDRNRLIDISQWGTNQWTSLANAFRGNTNSSATYTATDRPDLSQATAVNRSFMDCDVVPTNANTWGISTITNFADAFRGNRNRQAMPLDAWRPSAGTNFASFMLGVTDGVGYNATRLGAIYAGWPQGNLNNSQTITFGTVKYSAAGSAGRAFLAGTAASVSVSNATDNGGLIQITTSAAHGRTTGDFVYISGVGGVPNATGGRTITVIDSTNFTIDGSTFAGSYTSGGTVTTGRGWSITDGGLE